MQYVDVLRDGVRIKSRDDGNWHYEFYEYGNMIVGLQWHIGSYVSMWILDDVDVNLLKEVQ